LKSGDGACKCVNVTMRKPRDGACKCASFVNGVASQQWTFLMFFDKHEERPY